MIVGEENRNASIENSLNSVFNEFVRALDKYTEISYLENSDQSQELRNLKEKRKDLRLLVIEYLKKCSNRMEKWAILLMLLKQIDVVNQERKYITSNAISHPPHLNHNYISEGEFFSDIIIDLLE